MSTLTRSPQFDHIRRDRLGRARAFAAFIVDHGVNVIERDCLYKAWLAGVGWAQPGQPNWRPDLVANCSTDETDAIICLDITECQPPGQGGRDDPPLSITEYYKPLIEQALTAARIDAEKYVEGENILLQPLYDKLAACL